MFLDSNVLFSFTCSYAVYFCIKCGTAVESELYLPEFRCYFKCLVGGQPADFSCFPNAPQIKTPVFFTTTKRIWCFFFKAMNVKATEFLGGYNLFIYHIFRHINRGLSDIQSPNQAHSAYLLQIISTTLNHKITINIYLMKRNICDRIPENFTINIQQWWSTYILSNQ